jgi:hypothetical protein
MLTFHPSRAPGYGTTTYAHTPDGEATYTVSPWGRGWELHVTRWQPTSRVCHRWHLPHPRSRPNRRL